MAAIQIKNVPDDVHQKLRERAAEHGVSLATYLLELIDRELALPTNREWFDALEQREPVSLGSDEVVRAIHEAREERAQQIEGASRPRR
jgi:plasmid stability protein